MGEAGERMASVSESKPAQGEQPLVRQIDEVQPLVRSASEEQQQESSQTKEREEPGRQREAPRDEQERGEDKGLLQKIQDKLTGE